MTPAGRSGKYYIIHGTDELRRDRLLDQLRADLKGDPAMGDLNTSVLDGRQLTMGELRHVCDSVPFLADRRLAIVHGLLNRLAPERRTRDQDSSPPSEPGWKRTFVKELLDYLPSLPETTRLLFVESRTLVDSHPVVKLARAQGEGQGAYIRKYEAPDERSLPDWIQQQARERGGRVSPEAAALLAELIGSDLRLLDLELDKLLVYADERAVNKRDVELLVHHARETNVFDLVGCLGRRQADRALELLHGLLDDGEPALIILSMLARQVRLLIQVSELRAQRVAEAEMARRLGLPQWLPQKLLAQAGLFSMAELETAHRRLVETDQAIKTGQVDGDLALDLLLLDLTRD